MTDAEFQAFLKEISALMKKDPSMARKILKACREEMQRKRLLKMQGKKVDPDGPN